jgi:hypothetical protein
VIRFTSPARRLCAETRFSPRHVTLKIVMSNLPCHRPLRAAGEELPVGSSPVPWLGTGLCGGFAVMKPDLLLVVGGVSHAKLGQATADDVGDHRERRETPPVLTAEAVGVKVGGE